LFSETTTSSPAPPARRFSLGWQYFALFVIIVLVAGIRLRLRDFPLERDEGEYAYAGQLILQGIPPYQLAYNMKLPGTYAAYAAILAVFGQTPAAIHIGIALVNAASIFLVFLLVRRLFDPLAAVVSAATFGLFTIRPLLFGLAGHATHFVTLFFLLSLFVLLRAQETRKLSAFFVSGLLSGCALLMKQPGAFLALFVALYLCWEGWQQHRARRAIMQSAIAFSAGTILPYLLTCVILWRAGVFPKFWFWTVSYARAYGSELTLSEGLTQFANRMVLQKENMLLVWLFIVFGMAAFLWDRSVRPRAVFLLGLLACSFFALSVGFYYRGHYFILLYPALAMLAGIGVSSAYRLLERHSGKALIATAAPILFTVAFAAAVYADRKIYFVDSPLEACREIYGTNPFPETLVVADYIKAHSTPRDRIAVIGSEPQIYFYAQRRSVTGYIYTYPLVEEQQYGSRMQREMIQEVESAKPEFLVYVLRPESWLTRPGADQHIFDWAGDYTRRNYDLVGIADGGNHDIYRWGPEAATYRPRRPAVVLVYRRAS